MSPVLARPQSPGLRLDDIAARLRTHAWVQDARARRSPADPGMRSGPAPLIILVLPSAEGVHALRTSGKGHLAAAWARWLGEAGLECPQQVDWRLVEELPANGNEAATAPRTPWMPIVSDLALDERGLTCMLRVPFDMPVFRGHFPARPIVPGVMQIGWAATLSRDHGLATGPLTGIPAAKFQRLVRPGMQFGARLERDSRPGQVEFVFARETVVVTTGRLRFGDGRG